MIKGVFWGLVLLNGVVFTLIQLDVFATTPTQNPPQPFNADKISIVRENTHTETKPKTTPEEQPIAVETPTPSSAVLAASAPAALPEPELVKRACMEWGEFNPDELAAAKSALARFQLDAKTSEQNQTGTPSFWVYIPPAKDDAQLSEATNNLKTLGITDFFIVRDNNQWKHSISLGVFKTEEMAQHLLNALQDKGLKTAQLGKREKPGKTLLLISNLDEKMVAQVIDIKKQFKGSKLKRSTCTIPATEATL